MRTKSYQHLHDSGAKRNQEDKLINLMNYDFIKNKGNIMFPPTNIKNSGNNFSSRDSQNKLMHPVRLNYGLQPY